MSDRLEPDPIPRRDFLGLAALVSAGVTVLSSLVGMARLAKPRVMPEASNRFRAGVPSDYPAGTSKIIAGHNVRIIGTEHGIAAISLVCTHLGCIVDESPEGFSCPCHGSEFDADGKVTGGPAPRGLVWLALSRGPGGSLVIDKSQEVPPNRFYQA